MGGGAGQSRRRQPVRPALLPPAGRRGLHRNEAHRPWNQHSGGPPGGARPFAQRRGDGEVLIAWTEGERSPSDLHQDALVGTDHPIALNRRAPPVAAWLPPHKRRGPLGLSKQRRVTLIAAWSYS
ncbi:protein of unknown function [Magnetospirillum sp. XM-1]|nr:protein of unknown function [Magnetospirillum sp. XM-1]